MLTIFGKKKKDDSSVQIDTGTDAGQASSQTPSPMPPESMQTQTPVPTTIQNQPATWPTQTPVMSQPIPPPPALRKKPLYRESYSRYSKTFRQLPGPPSVQCGRALRNTSHYAPLPQVEPW